MKYILDASVALKWVLPEVGSDKAIALGEDFQMGIHELLAPDTFPVEVAHGLTRAERRGIIRAPEATQRFNEIAVALPQLHAYLPLLSRAIEMSSTARVGVYDCLYVALSEREQCQVVSADQRLVNCFPSNVIALATL